MAEKGIKTGHSQPGELSNNWIKNTQHLMGPYIPKLATTGINQFKKTDSTWWLLAWKGDKDQLIRDIPKLSN
jgi:hypothetical protein